MIQNWFSKVPGGYPLISHIRAYTRPTFPISTCPVNKAVFIHFIYMHSNSKFPPALERCISEYKTYACLLHLYQGLYQIWPLLKAWSNLDTGERQNMCWVEEYYDFCNKRNITIEEGEVLLDPNMNIGKRDLYMISTWSLFEVLLGTLPDLQNPEHVNKLQDLTIMLNATPKELRFDVRFVLGWDHFLENNGFVSKTVYYKGMKCAHYPIRRGIDGYVPMVILTECKSEKPRKGYKRFNVKSEIFKSWLHSRRQPCPKRLTISP